MAVVVSFVVVNYNGKKFLKECLDSIPANVSIPFEIVFVDNGSTDGSVDFVKLNYPHVKLTVSEKNLGFTGGNNLGASLAVGDYLILLNTDAFLKTDVSCLVDVFRSRSEVGVIGCEMTYGDGSFQPSFGYEHSPLRLMFYWMGLSHLFENLKIAMLFEKRKNLYKNAIHNVGWVSGAFLMVPRKLWLELNGLDEEYFMYVEDVDFCRRVRMRGLLVSYDPRVLVVHYGGGGRAWVGINAMKNTALSYIIHTKKFYSSGQVIFLRFTMCLIFFIRALVYRLCSLWDKSNIFREKSVGAAWVVRIMALGRHR